MTFWIACRVLYPTPGGSVFSVLGLYGDRLRAERRCTRMEDFVAPLKLDQDSPEIDGPWPGLYFPAELRAMVGGR